MRLMGRFLSIKKVALLGFNQRATKKLLPVVSHYYHQFFFYSKLLTSQYARISLLNTYQHVEVKCLQSRLFIFGSSSKTIQIYFFKIVVSKKMEKSFAQI